MKIEYDFDLKQTDQFISFWKLHKRNNSHFSVFEFQFKNNITGNWLYIKNHFKVVSVFLFSNHELKICASIFLPNNPSSPLRVGNIISSSDLNSKEISFFWNSLKNKFSNYRFLFPINGHQYFGFAFPLINESLNLNRIGFSTTVNNPSIPTIISDHSIHRRYFSLETDFNDSLISKIKNTLASTPKNIKIRRFNLLNAKKDINLMNEIVTDSFVDHFDFEFLSNEENWDLFKYSLSGLRHLYFMELDQEPVGFCLATKDYNEILSDQYSEFKNLSNLFFKKTSRARLIHIGIKQKYKGQGLIKFLRHHCLNELHKDGFKTFESSYIDEGNISSLKNVESTGAKLLNTFATFTIN